MNCIKTSCCKLIVSTLVDPLYIIKYYPYRYAFRLRYYTYYIGGFNINVGMLKMLTMVIFSRSMYNVHIVVMMHNYF